MRTSYYVGGLGLLMILATAFLHITYRGYDREYNLTITGHSSTKYELSGHPNDRKDYELDDGYQTIIYFTNNTSPQEAVKVRVGDFELTDDTNRCPIRSGDCTVLVPNIPYGQRRPARLEVNPDLEEEDFGEEYEFKFFIAQHPEGQFTEVDPDLEIDRFSFFRWKLAGGILGALLMIAAWMMRRALPGR